MIKGVYRTKLSRSLFRARRWYGGTYASDKYGGAGGADLGLPQGLKGPLTTAPGAMSGILEGLPARPSASKHQAKASI